MSSFDRHHPFGVGTKDGDRGVPPRGELDTARFPCVTVTQENNIVSCSRFISLSLSRSFSLPLSLSLLRTLNIARVVLLVYSLIYAARSVAPLPVLCTTRSSRSLQRVSHRSLAVPLTRRFCIVLSLSSAPHTAPCADPTRETDTRCFACVWHSECVSLSLFLCSLPPSPFPLVPSSPTSTTYLPLSLLRTGTVLRLVRNI